VSDRELFDAALAIADPARRAAYLAQACAGDAKLRQHIEGLLEMHGQLGSFLEAPALAHADTLEIRAAPEKPGTVIGPYKLLQEIGEGGMGTVFMAEQTHPVQRKVALKIIKPGMDSRQVLARFEAERQALALMDHPNIAKVLDVGTIGEGTRDEGRGTREDTSGPLAPRPSPLAPSFGRPYFVMELVKGVPITRYCDEQHLTPRERLELFVPVCHAVQHAHQKGVIHRDLKPSNVLVALYDGKPVPKVIDFGVAKATGPKLTERTLFTELGQVVGTLEYMSPEQAELNQLDVDTRSDVYSLGVLLYELLTGTTPLERKRLKEAAFLEVLRIIREEEPPTPSTRLSTSEGLPLIAANRGLEPRKLSGLVRGELDWIVMKALDKDRNRRYETASALAQDIERHLQDEPVSACPPSSGYRLRKFLRRHRGPVLAAALLVVTLVGGMAGTIWGLVRAEQAWQAETERADGEHRAKKAALAATEAEKGAKKEAQALLAEAQAVLDFMEKRVIAAARPRDQEGGLGYDVKLIEALKAALPFVKESFAGQPLIEARVRMTMGSSFSYLSDHQTAREQYQAARELRTRYLGPDHMETLISMGDLANALDGVGQHQEAFKLREEALARCKAKLGPDHDLTLGMMHNLAVSYSRLGRHQEALQLDRDTLILIRAKFGPTHPHTLGSMNNLAGAFANLGNYTDAAKIAAETLALRKAALGPSHPDTLATMNGLASNYVSLGRLPEALQLHQEALALRKAILGPVHRDTIETMFSLATTYEALGRHADALKLREETLALETVTLDVDHPARLASMHNLAESYRNLGRFREALKLHEETLKLRKAKLGPDHPMTFTSMNNLANTYYALRQYDEALKLYTESLALRRAKLGPEHSDTLGSLCNVAHCYAAMDRHVDAIKIYEEALPVMKAKIPNHAYTFTCMDNLATSYRALNRLDDACQLFEQTLALRKSRLGPTHPDTFLTMGILAETYRAVGRQGDALDLQKQLLAPAKESLGPDRTDIHESLQDIMRGYSALRRYADMLKLYEEWLPVMRTRMPDHSFTFLCMNNMASSYASLGRFPEALKLHEETLALRKVKQGPDHPDTLMSMRGVALILNKLDRAAEAIPLVDDCLRRATGKDLDPRLLPTMISIRIRHFEKLRDAAGCRATAEMWEKFQRTDAMSLYDAACHRGVTAAVIREAKNAGPDSTRLADEQADLAMKWLQKAVAAGYTKADFMAQDRDLAVLRDREDFQELVKQLQAKARKSGASAPKR
jgi:serine/threonine protein kinase/tetratricopeptide (TPR) repeat protein